MNCFDTDWLEMTGLFSLPVVFLFLSRGWKDFFLHKAAAKQQQRA
jgi:hypothetical protein